MHYRLLADLVLVVHVAFIAFVVAGFLLILLGGLLGWGWVRRPVFRLAHLAAIGLVTAQALLDIPCSLTVIENRLRQLAGQQGYEDGFIAHWLHGVIFFDAPAWAFTLAYTLFGLLVLAMFVLVPVRRRRSG